MENALLVLDCTQSLASVTCFSQQGHDVRMSVNAFLCCRSVSSSMPAIFLCGAIRLRHVLRLSDCPTSFTLLILTLPFLLMVHASTLSAILYSADAFSGNLMPASSSSSGNLMPASSSSSANASSDFNSLTSDA